MYLMRWRCVLLFLLKWLIMLLMFFRPLKGRTISGFRRGSSCRWRETCIVHARQRRTCSSPDPDLPTVTPMMDLSYTRKCDELSQQSTVTMGLRNNKKVNRQNKEGIMSIATMRRSQRFLSPVCLPAAFLYKYTPIDYVSEHLTHLRSSFSLLLRTNKLAKLTGKINGDER
jgi:hypothetical protein